MYVDIVETLSVTYAPSGRPLAAFANGSIAFTSKVSGVPDLLLSLRAGSGPGADKVKRTMERPVFHPCVRLARWRDHAELSFVPPDGRFVLAGYDVDLLDPSASPLSAKAQDLNLPASIEIRTGLGATGSDFEVRLTVSHRFYTGSGSSGASSSSGIGSAAATSLSNNLGASRPSTLRGNSGEAKAPLLEDLTVSIPITAAVRNISDLRATKGEAHWSPGDASIEWKISAKEAAGISSAGCVLRCSLVGASSDDEDEPLSNGMKTNTHDYDDDEYQISDTATSKHNDVDSAARDKKKSRQNAVLMPGSASLSFGVKGWLASGLKVDSLVIDTKRSKGLGEGVRPYKGVKYLTVSRKGVEVRC